MAEHGGLLESLSDLSLSLLSKPKPIQRIGCIGITLRYQYDKDTGLQGSLF
ncbi:hypothetical protein PtB15_3B820 [Puccinia triticina]|nr:hypothetical protein PtB15_3B820 [Puccinia triticina]